MDADSINSNPQDPTVNESNQNTSSAELNPGLNPQPINDQNIASMPSSYHRLFNRKLLFIVLALVLITLITIAGIKFAGNKKQPDSEKRAMLPTLAINSPVPSATETISQPTETSATNAIECSEFPDKLSSCSKYECTFTHPITNEKMKREITGLTGDKCGYIEQMPNNGQMKCDYTHDTRMAVSMFIKNTDNAKSSSTRIHLDLEPTGVSPTIVHTIDNKTVDNPLQDALISGECVITGY